MSIIKNLQTYNGRSVVTTLSHSFLNGSSSFLQVTRTSIKVRMSLIFRHTHPPATELAALEHLQYNCIMLCVVGIVNYMVSPNIMLAPW